MGRWAMGMAAIAVVALGATPLAADAPQPRGALFAGAARIEITPQASELVPPFTRINDPVHVRVVVIESGGKRAVLVVADVPMIQAKVMAEMVTAIANAAKVPPANVLLSASHTHNTMRVDPNPGGIILPGSPVFTAKVRAATLAAVDQAVARLKPARIGFGEGHAWLVGGKNSWSAKDGRWVEAIDRSPSARVSRALGVIKLERLDGTPIAFVLNYAINPVISMAMKDAISGDVPGAAARYVERRAGGDAVALFTVGAAGNPLYRANDPGPYKPSDAQVLLSAMGTLLGEEALAVARETVASDEPQAIAAASGELICPGKVTNPLNLPDRCSDEPASTLPACTFTDKPADPVRLAMGALRIGPWALVHSDANISASVGLKLQATSPWARTWVVGTNYGPMKYVVSESDYPLNTYEATASAARRGCAEQGYLDAALALLKQSR